MTWEQSIRYESERFAKEKVLESAENLLRLNKLSETEIAQCCSLPLEEVLALKERLALETAPVGD